MERKEQQRKRLQNIYAAAGGNKELLSSAGGNSNYHGYSPSSGAGQYSNSLQDLNRLPHHAQ